MQPLLVAAAVIRRGDQVLITRRPEGVRDGGRWEFPGGKIDAGESPEECLRREIREELDLDVEVGRILEVIYHRHDWGSLLLLFYDCRPLSETLRNLQVAEHRWVLPEELPEFDLLPADRPLIARLRQAG